MACNRGSTHLDCEALSEAGSQVVEAKEDWRDIASIQNTEHDRFILGMPVEIATRILSLDVQHGLSSNPARPLQLSAVCRGWRFLVFSTSQLWTTMICMRQQTTWCFPLELVDSWIQRAGTRLMDITVLWDSRKRVGQLQDETLLANSDGLVPLVDIIEKPRSLVGDLNLLVPHTCLQAAFLSASGSTILVCGGGCIQHAFYSAFPRPLHWIELTPGTQKSSPQWPWFIGKSSLQRLLVLPVENSLKFKINHPSTLCDSIEHYQLNPSEAVLKYYGIDRTPRTSSALSNAEGEDGNHN